MNIKRIMIAAWLGLMCGAGLRAQTYEELIGRSYDCLDRGDLPAAEQALKAALHLEPANRNNFALLSNLGTIQRRMGRRDEALTSYTAALGLQPDNKLILTNRAELFVERGETELALADYEALLRADPADIDARFRRGMLYVELKEFMSADADFERILQIDPDSKQGRLGFALLDRARGNYADSEAVLNYLIGRDPNDLRLYEERAELYFLMKKNARAMADLRRVFAGEKEPSAYLYILRGKVRLAQYEKEAAASDFKKALDLGADKSEVEGLMKMTY